MELPKHGPCGTLNVCIKQQLQEDHTKVGEKRPNLPNSLVCENPFRGTAVQVEFRIYPQHRERETFNTFNSVSRWEKPGKDV